MSSYKGDGQMIDYGPKRLVKRYVVAFGSVALNTGSKKTFHASGLAVREFVLGFEIASDSCAIPRSDDLVQLVVTNELHQVVINESHPISNYVWTRAARDCRVSFWYIRGGAKEVTLKNGGTCNDPIYTGADHGGGTYFTSRDHGEYEITVSVVPRGGGMQGTASVQLRDNGPPSTGPSVACN